MNVFEESTSQGRFYILDTPVASPGCCVICGYSGNGRKYLDPRLDFEFYGSAIFCFTCIEAMGQMIGSASVERTRLLTRKIYDLQDQLASLTDRFNSARELFDDIYSSGSSDNVVDNADDSLSDEPENDSEFNELSEGEGSRDSEVDFSDFIERSHDVRSDSGNQSTAFEFKL